MSDITIMSATRMRPRRNIPRRRLYSIGPLYITSSLIEAGYDVDFVNFQTAEFRTMRDIISRLGNSSDIVGVSCALSATPSVIYMLKKLKKEYPEKTIIMGGPDPTLINYSLLRKFPFIDIVVRGEGEKTIVELMDCLKKNKDLKNVRGITYRDGNKIHVNPPQPRIEDLDKIPFPAYDKVDMKKYILTNTFTLRGCPYKCAFCTHPIIWRGGVFFRSIDNVTEELKLLNEKYKKNFIGIMDDTFNLNKKRVIEFCDKLKKERMDINWYCDLRVDLVDKESIKKMAESGCVSVLFGIESGSNRILKIINKGFTIEKARRAVKLTKKYINSITASFIWGYPFESMKDFILTKKIMEEFRKIGVNNKCGILRPDLGTEIYSNYKDNFLLPIPGNDNIFFYDNDSDMFPLPDINNKVIFNMVLKNPDVFPGFYRYKTPCLEKKIDIMSSILEEDDKWKAFFENLRAPG